VRAVFDTNVLVAAFVTEGICSKLLTRGRKKEFDLIICPVVLQEFERVLIKKLSATRNEARNALQIVSEAICGVVHPLQYRSWIGLCSLQTSQVQMKSFRAS